MRRLACVLVLLLLAVPMGGATNAGGGSEIIVAVIDTGADADHPAFANGQIVAWWDFTTERKDASQTNPFAYPGRLWDPVIAAPFDPNGHGTATASLVGGKLTTNGCGLVSHSPGVKLAILKVGNGAEGDIEGDLALAIRWATQVVKADVISMSIGAIVPTPNVDPDTFDAIAEARARGVLPVVAAGNGAANVGLIPVPTWATMYGSSRDVLAVGGGTVNGTTLTSTTGNHDPDVSAASDRVCAARPGGGYARISGTSFAAPLVAGMAAEAMERAVAAGSPADPDRIETLLKHCARDTVAPYTREGWGFLGPSEVPCILNAATSGTIPAYAGSAVNPVYGDVIVDAYRLAFSTDVLHHGAMARVGPALTPAGVLGASAPGGLFEGEAYTFMLAAGATTRLTARYVAPDVTSVGGIVAVPDFDMAIFPAPAYADGILLAEERVALIGAVGGVDESTAFTAPATGSYLLVVYGFAITTPIAYTLESDVAVTLADDALFTGQNALA